MKKLKVFAMMLCIATLGLNASCSKDFEDDIVGKWEMLSFPEEDLIGTVWNFTDNNTFTVSSYGYVGVTGTYEIDDDQMTLTLNIDNEVNIEHVTITDLTSSEMKWKTSEGNATFKKV